MSPILKSIIHTVAFYDAVGSVPLTKGELYKHLIYAPDLAAAQVGSSHVSFASFLRTLDEEWPTLKPYIHSYRGFYFLHKNSNAYTKRIAMGKTSIAKWRIAKRMIALISFVPYVRMVAVTGSLALNATHKGSDIDVLIVAKSGHIWTARAFISALMQAFGKRRYGQFIRDRICLNHYVSDKETVLRPDHLFSRHICSTLVPVWRQESYTPPFLAETTTHLSTMHGRHWSSYFLRNSAEFILSKTISYKLEQVLRSLQMRKIHGRPKPSPSASYGAGEFIADDNALVFHHPRPQNQEALYLYRQNLEQLSAL